MGAVLTKVMLPEADPLRNDPRGFGPFSLGDPARDQAARAAHAANIGGRGGTSRGISPVRQGGSRRRPSLANRRIGSLLNSPSKPLGV